MDLVSFGTGSAQLGSSQVRSAILLSFHGTIADLDEIPAFLSRVRRGRPAPPGLLKDLRHRFEAIGGSPLLKITQAQANALEERLRMPVALGARLWHPTLGDVISKLSTRGINRIVSLPLAPQSVHVYHDAIVKALQPFSEIELVRSPAWGLEPALIDAFAQTIRESLRALDPSSQPTVGIVLSAHSLPQSVIDAGDPYESDFRATATEVASRFPDHRCEIAFQSQGADGGAWLGPDLKTAFAKLLDAGLHRIVVAPIGFVSDHLETLYDLDIEAKGVAMNMGIIEFVRAPALNARPQFIDVLEAIVRRTLSNAVAT